MIEAEAGALRPLAATTRPTTLSERLRSRRQQLESELVRIRKAEALLEQNPAFKELFDIVSQVRCM